MFRKELACYYVDLALDAQDLGLPLKSVCESTCQDSMIALANIPLLFIVVFVLQFILFDSIPKYSFRSMSNRHNSRRVFTFRIFTLFI